MITRKQNNNNNNNTKRKRKRPSLSLSNSPTNVTTATAAAAAAATAVTTKSDQQSGGAARKNYIRIVSNESSYASGSGSGARRAGSSSRSQKQKHQRGLRVVSCSSGSNNNSNRHSHSHSHSNSKNRRTSIPSSSLPAVVVPRPRVRNPSTLGDGKLLVLDQQQQQQQQQVLTLCGACNHPLHSPPPSPFSHSSPTDTTTTNTTSASANANASSSAINQDDFDYRTITCANYSKDPKLSKCRTTPSNNSKTKNSYSGSSNGSSTRRSPHFHFCCSGIPHKSSLYSKLDSELEKKELKQLQKREKRQERQEQRQRLAAVAEAVNVDIGCAAAAAAAVTAGRGTRAGSRSVSPIPTNTNPKQSSSLSSSSSSSISSTFRKNNNGSSSATSSSSSSPLPFFCNPIINEKAPVSQFLCPACDIKGTSMYLYEYFYKIHELKVQYHNDHEAVYTIQPVGYVSADSSNAINKNMNRNRNRNMKIDNGISVAKGKNKYTHNNSNASSKSSNAGGNTSTNNSKRKGKHHTQEPMGMGKDNGFVSYLIEHQMQKQQQQLNQHKQLNTSTSSTSTSTSTRTNTTTNSQKQYKNTELRLDHIRNILDNIPSSSSYMGLKDDDHGNGGNVGNDDNIHNIIDKKKPFQKIDSTYLVGQPIRLFCDLSNCYYTGRIISSRVVQKKDLYRLKRSTKEMYKNGTLKNCRANDIGNVSNYHSDSDWNNTRPSVFLDKDIGRTQYLIRFRAGAEGRKVAVHEWVFLEEHPIMVAISLIWANIDFYTNLGRNQLDQNDNTTCSSTTSKLSTACSRQNKTPTQFRPMQLFVRTALEMIELEEINNLSPFAEKLSRSSRSSRSVTESSVNVIGIFFSRKFQSMVLRLNKKNDLKPNNPIPKKNSDKLVESGGVMSKVSSVLESIGGLLSSTKSFALSTSIIDEKKSNHEDGGVKEDFKSENESNTAESTMDYVIADFNNPPLRLQSHFEKGKSFDEMMNVSVSLATMEAEEQLRVNIQRDYI